LTFIGELLCLLMFTNAAYLAPIQNGKTLLLLLSGTATGAAILAISSGLEFHRDGRGRIKDNPPVVLLLLVASIHVVVALLKFVIFR
jgi:hypothetical protein